MCKNQITKVVNAELTMTYRFARVLVPQKKENRQGFVLQVAHDGVVLLLPVEELVLNIWIYLHL